MDYFVAVPQNTSDAGLRDLFARATLSLSDGISIGVWIHQFRQDSDSTNLGREVDCTVSCKVNSFVAVDGGLCAFFPGAAMKDKFAAGGTGYWGFLSTSLSF